MTTLLSNASQEITPAALRTSPWHRGERSIHEKMGTATQMEAVGQRVIRDYMPDQHRQFFEQIPFIVVGAVDEQGQPWATLLEGEPGFMQSPTAQSLQIHATTSAGDALDSVLKTRDANTTLGLLGIELHTRRRNRMNGEIVQHSEDGFSVHVGHSFGNCPQYIQKRHFSFARPPSSSYSGEVERLTALDDAARQMIASADTFFVASHFPGDAEHANPSCDVSHRGGKPGFVQIDGDLLKIPDFAGNLHFNTFGNLLVYPRSGLLFVDFSNGDMLQITGAAQVIFDSAEIAAFQGAERIWTFQVQQVVRRRGALALRWQFDEFSPNSLMTGSWQDASAKLQAQTLRNTWRPFRIAKIEQESSTVRSFYLEPTDGYALAAFEAGQHLPIRLRLEAETQPTLRNYTLSSAPSDGFYRLSIKREGRFSTHMHQQMQVGDVLEARAPQGQFVIDALQRRPAVLLAGGIGITPLLAMARQIVFEGLRKRRVRPTYLFYAVRHHAERGFEEELRALVAKANGALRLIRVTSAPEADAFASGDEVHGRIDITLLKAKLPFDDYDFYLCGAAPFMQTLYDGLRALRIADDRIFAESFGPAALQRQLDAHSVRQPLAAVSQQDVPVAFSESGKEARWTPDSGSLLELAEARGLTPEFSCRSGSCGSCRTQVLAGEVTYQQSPAFQCEPNEALLCCAMPAQSATGKVIPLVLKL